MDREIHQLLTRGVTALEQLAADPVVNIETGPPVCPFCEHMNPRVMIRESEASGLLGAYLIQANCQHCGNLFYAMPRMWFCVKSVEEARAEIESREP